MSEDNLERLKKTEEGVNRLTTHINALRELVGEELRGCPEIVGMVAANNKLLYRLRMLKKATEDEMKSGPKMKPGSSTAKQNGIYLYSILKALTAVFTQALEAAFPDMPEVPVSITTSNKFADYQCNSAMPISQLLKARGIKANPREVAQKILASLKPHPLVEKTEIAGPGFINIWLSRGEVQRTLEIVLRHGVVPPPLTKRLRVVVDFSSPNIAKEMHVGHLRSTIIGESVCRLLEFLGHDVVRVNHVGDWGTQFGMLIAHLQDMFPNYLDVSPPIADLQAFYRASKKRFDEDEEFKKRAYACVVRLQNHDEDYRKAWQLICDVSRKEFQKVYDRLEVTLTERGESFYQSRMETLVPELEAMGLLEEDEGRKIMWGDETRTSIPFTIVKKDGGFTYDTSDMATIRHRVQEERGDWLIYITDAGQATHFEVLIKCATRWGILDPTKVRIDHVGFGVVLGEDKKRFKTRSGETVRLIDLLDEGLRRAEEKLKERGRDQVLTSEEQKAAVEAVAYGCIKYADISHNRTHDYVFSFDKMLDDRGNTAVYLIYALTRIRSIARGAQLSPEQLQEAAKNTPLSLDHEKEWKLAKVLVRFPEVLDLITDDLCLHHLCEFLYEVTSAFSDFYESCYCIEKSKTGEVKVNMGRIMLCEVTARIMETCFHIAGLKTVARM